MTMVREQSKLLYELIDDAFRVVSLSGATLILAELLKPGFVSAIVDLNLVVVAWVIIFILRIAFAHHVVVHRFKKIYTGIVLAFDSILLWMYISLQFKNYLLGLLLLGVMTMLAIATVHYDRRRYY